jgi:hypothetical protein
MVKADELPKAIKNPRNAVKVANSRVDNYLSKFIFKNSAGLKNNLRGRKTAREMEKIRKTYRVSFKTDPNVLKFEQVGHVFLGNIYDDSLIKEIAERFNSIIENPDFSFVRSQFEGQVFSRQIRLVHKNIPQIKKLLSQKVIELFESYYKTPIKVIDVYAWRNYHVPAEIAEKHEMFSSYWHCDGRDTTWTKLFVYLTDVTLEDGPFTVQSIDRTKELMKMGFVNRREPGISNEILEDPNHVTKYTGKSGATLAANTTVCLHKAGIPAPGHYRDLIQFQIAPSAEPIKDDWTEKLESVKDYNERIEQDDTSNKSIT